MLQVTLDPSSLLPFVKGKDTVCSIVNSISGMSWKKETGIPPNFDIRTAKKFLYPWNWDRPEKMRIYWIVKEGRRYESISFQDLKVHPTDAEVLSLYGGDKEKLKVHYEAILDKKIFSKSPINLDEIEMTFAEKEKQEITVNDDKPVAGTPTGFYNNAMAQFSQRSAPLNELLGFIFFAPQKETETLKCPDVDIKGFVVFPFSERSDSRWFAKPDMPKRLLSGDIGEGDFVQFNVIYAMLPEHDMKVYCPLTPLPEGGKGEPIIIRDKNGKFAGHVDLAVNDVEDQIEAILSESAQFFSLPSLFLNFVEANKGKITSKNASRDYASWMEKIDLFLWSVLRDSLGFGFRKESDNRSIADRLIRHYCNTKFKNEVQDLEPARQLEYWQRYNLVVANLQLVWSALDSKYDLNKWKLLLQKNLSVREKELTDAEIDLEQKTVRLNNGIFLILGKLELAIKENDVKEIVNGKINNWIAQWKELFRLLHFDHQLAVRILFEQWIGIDAELKKAKMDVDDALEIKPGDPLRISKLLMWFEKALTDAGEVVLLQQESIAVTFRNTIMQSINLSAGADSNLVATDILNAMKDYANLRVDDKKNMFTPNIADRPFDKAPADVPTAPTWQDFVDSFKSGFRDMQKAVEKEMLRPFSIPPNLQIRVDGVLRRNSLNDDDLNDEIAGHIVLMQRADKLNDSTNFSNTWRYLNWAKVNMVTRMPHGETRLDKSYLIPAFIPEPENNKIPFLQLSNEKLSLVAGHKAFDDSRLGDNGDEILPAYTEYNFDDRQPMAYATWYGYHYRFAGFVALNSGVLPVELRDNTFPDTLNLPRAEPNLTGHKPIEEYYHLRRVPVSKARVEVKNAQGQQVLTPPQKLLPLAFELPEWKDNRKGSIPKPTPQCKNEITKGALNEQSHYLLADGLEGEYQQTRMQMKLRMPTTSFWNWFAWLGENAMKPVKPGDPTYAQVALERELKIRDDANNSTRFDGDGHLCDPALDTRFVISLEKLFPKKEPKKWGIIEQKNGNDHGLNDVVSLLEIKSSSSVTDMIKDAAFNIQAINIQFGDVVRIHVHCLVKSSYLIKDSGDQKFHPWMNAVLDSGARPSEQELPGVKDYLLTKPVETWFESALKPDTALASTQKKAKALWDSLSVTAGTDKVEVRIKKQLSNCTDFAYCSRLQIKHQVWNWNGRLDESEKYLADQNELDPIAGITTPAMLWEAWSFSDRPDFSALIEETNLAAFRVDPCFDESSEQLVFTDRRPGDEKALYYRFAAVMYSRYELLGPSFVQSIEGKTQVDKTTRDTHGTENEWRRFLRKCTKTKQLPKPSVRFILPLTKSIKECNDGNEVGSASLLIVLNDKWFSEAGIAEQLEIGVDILKFKDKSYLNAGNDPILADTSMGPLKEANGEEIYYFSPNGPVGLTFDLAAQTPRLKGCAFILELPNLSEKIDEGTDKIVNKLKPWSLMQVAVRRALRPKLCQDGMPVEQLYSDWSAKEWVQFLPSVDSFIPDEWRKSVSMQGFIQLQQQGSNISFDPFIRLPEFDPVFEEKMERFIVVTEKVYDIGGQPCERYIATYRYHRTLLKFALDPEGNIAVPDFSKIKEGYVRMLLVRNFNGSTRESIWERLFGENVKQRVDLTSVQNDPTAALPIFSERIRFRT